MSERLPSERVVRATRDWHASCVRFAGAKAAGCARAAERRAAELTRELRAQRTDCSHLAKRSGQRNAKRNSASSPAEIIGWRDSLVASSRFELQFASLQENFQLPLIFSLHPLCVSAIYIAKLIRECKKYAGTLRRSAYCEKRWLLISQYRRPMSVRVSIVVGANWRSANVWSATGQSICVGEKSAFTSIDRKLRKLNSSFLRVSTICIAMQAAIATRLSRLATREAS